MAIFVSNSVTLEYGSTSQAFTALSCDDESFEIVSLPKERLDKTLLENIIGYRNIYNIRVQQITSAQRNFLYNFIQSDDQAVTINGVSHDVNLRDADLMLDLLDGYIDNVVLTMEFEDRAIVSQFDFFANFVSRTQGVTDNSAGYSSVGNTVGTDVILTYNYFGTDTGRRFRINSINFYKANIIDKRWEYVDRNRGFKRLGYRLLYDIDFGNFGLGQTQAQLADDRAFLKEFVLAPNKYISGNTVYLNNVVNDFDEVRYSFIGSPYSKTTRLQFKAQSLATNIPTTTTFIMDSGQGILDTNTLG